MTDMQPRHNQVVERCPACGAFYNKGDVHQCVVYSPPPEFLSQSRSAEAPSAPMEAVQPVYGWLVCLNGVEEGRGYRLVEGKNSIGGGEDCAVSLGVDGDIAQDASGALVCDPVQNIFFLMNLAGRDVLRVNGALLVSPSILAGGELIGIGKRQLRFVPFCGERFQWD